MTRGRLPASVYWRRRLFVGLLALSIVFVIASLLGAGSDGSSAEPVAQQSAEAADTDTSSGATTTPPSAPATVAESPTQEEQATELAAPSGTCAPEDVRITPITQKAVAGRDVEIDLSLQTRTDPACHWRVGAKQLAVRISGQGGEVWSTRHCQQGIPSKTVVLRKDVATKLTFTWDARRSDEGCPKATEWVLPGEYVVTAAALGGEPQQQTLELVAPSATQRPEPKAEESPKAGEATEQSTGNAQEPERSQQPSR